MKKISDNESSKEISDGIKAFDALAKLAGFIPFVRSSQKLASLMSDLEEIKAQSGILSLPDRFNEKFSKAGWIAYESMNVDLMKRALRIEEAEGIEAAEKELANHYDQDALKFGLMRFNVIRIAEGESGFWNLRRKTTWPGDTTPVFRSCSH